MNDWKVTIEEFECKCGCGQNGVDINFLRKLNEARDLADIPFIISSGYRCQKHNKEIGGVPDSAHTKGMAVDITCKDSRTRY
ncbi:MAG: D-Ala-D-Ala carboxypeptidase family metallohydrolase, partial [Bacteroidales bacterium]